MPAPGRTAADLAERLLAGDKRALARAISLVENETAEGAVYVYRGSPAGLETVPSRVITSDTEGLRLGFALSAVGDLDGDGLDDLLAGAPAWMAGQGEVWLIPGM